MSPTPAARLPASGRHDNQNMPSANQKESSSDSELSSVSRMMDATSSTRIQQFLTPGPLESSMELDRDIPELSIDLTEADADKVGRLCVKFLNSYPVKLTCMFTSWQHKLVDLQFNLAFSK